MHRLLLLIGFIILALVGISHLAFGAPTPTPTVTPTPTPAPTVFKNPIKYWNNPVKEEID